MTRESYLRAQAGVGTPSGSSWLRYFGLRVLMAWDAFRARKRRPSTGPFRRLRSPPPPAPLPRPAIRRGPAGSTYDGATKCYILPSGERIPAEALKSNLPPNHGRPSPTPVPSDGQEVWW